MEESLGVLLVLAVASCGVGMMLWTFARGRELLIRWASENGYQILQSEFRWFRRGPFFWTSSKGQVIYHVVVRAPDGTTRSGWVRCGSFWWGVFGDKTETRWET